MQLRCYRCGWSFAIKQEEIAFALQALEQDGGGHYDVRCPRCRHANRVSVEQLQRASPRRRPGTTAPSSPARGSGAAAGNRKKPGQRAAPEPDPDATPMED